MRNILIAGILLALAGCRNVDAPSTIGQPAKVDDPRLSIAEQQRLGRDRYAIPDDSTWALPPTGLPRPGTWGAVTH